MRNWAGICSPPFLVLRDVASLPSSKMVPFCQLCELFLWRNYLLLPHHKPLLTWAMGLKNSWASKKNCSCELVCWASVGSVSFLLLLLLFPSPFLFKCKGSRDDVCVWAVVVFKKQQPKNTVLWICMALLSIRSVHIYYPCVILTTIHF